LVRAVYPGSFDPVHNGHVDVVSRASRLFEQLTVAIYESPPKRVLFSTDERVALFQASVAHLPNVDVISFSGLVAPDLARKVSAGFVVRGLRAGVDFETEFEMTLMWRTLDPEIDVVCLMSALQYQFVYSSRIKEVAKLGGDVQGLVPQPVATELTAKFKSVSQSRD
jgi:pantetheine-phosphate adenylyltransferase